METNPSANIYNKFNNYKKITRDLENETKAPSTKGLLSRDMSMKQMPMRKEAMQDDPFDDAMNFFEAIQNERLKFHDDGAGKVTEDIENKTLERFQNRDKFTGKEYMPVIPSYQKGLEITDTPGISTKRSTRDSVTTYTGREIRRRNRDKKLEI